MGAPPLLTGGIMPYTEAQVAVLHKAAEQHGTLNGDIAGMEVRCRYPAILTLYHGAAHLTRFIA